VEAVARFAIYRADASHLPQGQQPRFVKLILKGKNKHGLQVLSQPEQETEIMGTVRVPWSIVRMDDMPKPGGRHVVTFLTLLRHFPF